MTYLCSPNVQYIVMSQGQILYLNRNIVLSSLKYKCNNFMVKILIADKINLAMVVGTRNLFLQVLSFSEFLKLLQKSWLTAIRFRCKSVL